SCAAKMRPVELDYGQYLLFDPRCLHATQNNVTDSTRISTDVRIILRRHMESLPIEYRGTGRLRMLFAPGHYYDATPISALPQYRQLCMIPALFDRARLAQSGFQQSRLFSDLSIEPIGLIDIGARWGVSEIFRLAAELLDVIAFEAD